MKPAAVWLPATALYLGFRLLYEDAFLAMPSFCRISSIKHQRVSADWNRWAPT